MSDVEVITPTLIWCPVCKKLHVDEGEWETKPHRTHRCVKDAEGTGCGHEWRVDGDYMRGVSTVEAALAWDAARAESTRLRAALTLAVQALEAADASIKEFRLADIGFPKSWREGPGTRDEMIADALAACRAELKETP